MKLNKAQIEALAAKIVQTHRDEKITPIKEYNSNIEKSEEYKIFISKNKICQSLEPYKENDSIYGITGDINCVQKHIRNEYFKDQFKKVPNELSYNKTIDAITLATIDKTTVEDIIASVKGSLW